MSLLISQRYTYICIGGGGRGASILEAAAIAVRPPARPPGDINV